VRLAQNGTEAPSRNWCGAISSACFRWSGILRRPEDLEDVAQQVFLKAYLESSVLTSERRFNVLYKIAVNECWDYLRKKKVRPGV